MRRREQCDIERRRRQRRWHQSAVRDRYGRHMFGQSLLLARRLRLPLIGINMRYKAHAALRLTGLGED